MELRKKIDFGHLVSDLRIGMEDYDSEFVTALPTIFSHVRHLEWGPDKPYKRYDSIDLNSPGLDLTNWIQLKSIVDHSLCLDLTTRLLETAICKVLTSIEVSFCISASSIVVSYDKMKTLIASIHKTPSLERIGIKGF